MPGQNAEMEFEEAAKTAELPRNLRDYRDYHKDETILVCGCGASLTQVASPEKLITIGVNDVGRLFHPDYLVILNPRSQFAGDRFKYVENSQASAIFTQLNLGISHPNIVRFRLGQRGGTELRDDDCLPYTRNSPYVALCLAAFMGAQRIGLIGVDFTNDHFFAKTGTHALAREFPQIDREYRQLYEACRARGIEIFNLSGQSRLTALPRMPFQEFVALSRQAQKLNIVSYSVTPVAGVPVILSQCIAARTAHNCRTVWASNSYGNGVAFPGDVEWGNASAEAEELLCSADLVIAHNGKVAPRHKNLLAGKPVITMAHNYMWNVDTSHVQQKLPGVVVGQYQATLPDFHGWQVVPNPMPLWDGNFQPGTKNPEITICYTPSGKHERYPADHRLYWHSKGYATTMRVLDRLARRLPVRLETLNGQQVSHAKSLAMKQRSHIVIDECVTGSYHRNSLEGLAAGCVVVNALGHLPAVKDVFRYCSGSDQVPFVYATLESLEEVLEELIERGIDALTAEGARNRSWMEEHWDFEKQWGRFWEPVVDQALQRAHAGASKTRVARVRPRRESSVTAEPASQARLSVVVCQGGQERLRQLAACLVSLRQCRQVGEIVVVDMGSSPFAADLGRRWADKYVFIKNDGLFERARSLNIGTALAEHDLVLWMDNDLLLSPEFIPRAIAEMGRRQLDYLIPYTQVKYLSETDTQQIIMGTRNPDDCPPASVLRAPRGATGGMGLVKKSFVQTHGGMLEDFRGWGGEDDAWWHKARLLGRAAATEQRDQQLYHMFHANSGCYARQKQSNPHYGANLAVLREIWSIRDRQKFLNRFPPPSRVSLGWNDKRIGIARPDSEPESIPAMIVPRLAELTSAEIHSHVTRAGDPSLGDWVSQMQLDALVIFDMELAAGFLGNEAYSPLWPRTIFAAEGSAMPANFGQQLQRAGAIVSLQGGDAELRKAGIEPWKRSDSEKTPLTAFNSALALLQPLSLLIEGAIPPAREPGPAALAHSAGRLAGHTPLPVWMYWEGPCPEWIKRCQQTAFAQARDVRLLSAADFEKLRNSDLDIDLSRLHVAQRADFVRAFLLARYGGLWLDSDCLVMQPLGPLLQALEQYDFIGHRERTLGVWANDFMGAAPGSRIAAAFYQHICRTLRSRKTVGWLDLGAQALTQVLKTTGASWFEIKVEHIQPLCWSRYTPFFEIKTAAEHAQALDRRAICYMLSNHTMQRELRMDDLSERLLLPGTFFRYLLDQINASSSSTLQTEDQRATAPFSLTDIGFTQPLTQIFNQLTSSIRKHGNESLGGPGSSLLHTTEVRQRLPLMLQNLDINSLLDVGCSDFNWLQHAVLGVEHYIGVDLLPETIEQNRKKFGAPDREFLALDATRHALPNVDLILCRDFLVLFSFEDIFRALKNFKTSGSRYLLATTFANRDSNSDISTGGWRPLNLECPPFNFPPPLRMMNEKCKEAGNAYSDKSLGLWRIEDISVPEAISVDAAPAEKPSQNRACSAATAAYEIAVILPVSIANAQSERRRNLQACLRALNSQELERDRYRIIVVEEDSEPRLQQLCAGLADDHIFAYNAGSFNKGWAFNIGACAAALATEAFCLMDADILPARSFLSSCLQRMRSGYRALRPYAEITYMTPAFTEQAIQDRGLGQPDAFVTNKYRGQSFHASKGGCLFIEPKLYREIHGFDERFRGFGYEDTEFWDRVAKHTAIDILPGTLLHMHHAKPIERNLFTANAGLHREIARGSIAAWSGPMGELQRYSEKPAVSAGEPFHSRNAREEADGKERMGAFARMVTYCSRARMESVSGPGSSLAQTAAIRRELPGLIRDIGAKAILDAPCGDFHWMSQVDLQVDEYTGIDLLPAIIEKNQMSFAGKGRKFLALDIAKDSLPAADLILCRDCLVHFSYADIWRTLRNFKASNSKYLLTTHFEHRPMNTDITTGDWRPLSFRIAPFNFPEPLRIIREKCTENGGKYADKSLALWSLEQISL